MSNFYDKLKTGSPYVIAELGSNHNGDMELAKSLIKAAKDAGADCVKFQSWSKDSIFSKVKYDENHFIGDDYRDRDDFTLEQIVDKFAISEQELIAMKQFADEVGIDCSSTPFSRAEADFLVEHLDAKFIKVASMDLSNYPFLEYLAKKGLPMVISTGMSELHEIDRAVRTIENAGNKQITILHCVAIYPPEDEQVNLNNIDTLRSTYPDYPIGFSDHTLGTCIPLAAAAKGARLIEKHFTLDKNMFGWDHKVSANSEEMEIICRDSKRISTALGSNRITVVENTERMTEFRRSIVCVKELEPGHVITENDIEYKRPATGIAPEYHEFIVGRTVKNKISADYPIKLEDLV